MKRIVSFSFLTILLTLFAMTWETGIVSAKTSSVSEQKKMDNFEMPKISKARTEKLKKLIKSKKPVKNLSTNKLNNNNLDPNASISSYGEIVKPGEIKKYLKKHPNILKPTKETKKILPSNSTNFINSLSSDNRERVDPTTNYPYNAIAQIDFYDPKTGYGYSCSGAYIDENTVLTAAHCVFDTYNNHFYAGWTVYPGENGTTFPYAPSTTTNAYVLNGYKSAQPADEDSIYYSDVQYDYAVLNLDSSHPHNLAILADTQNVGDSIYSAGYPGDHKFKEGSYYYYYMYRTLGSIEKLENGIITHNCYVTSGMSGGPLFYPDGITGVIGVNSTSSWAPELTQSDKDTISYWAVN